MTVSVSVLTDVKKQERPMQDDLPMLASETKNKTKKTQLCDKYFLL